ncbi:MAG: N-acetylmuramoyl-L-alanine amidase [Christensenella sp.]|uniref:N-acetylmuramoyl-L-alanine amidase n=1 Tax=Christensenella sp. TaxID=1935934 RepID=UPI002B220B95|nr:N-acetylmuramoyl-L-alanine amidase [Christensenella sp.]MEA5003084.1 N-acetylmuramoyl-L-alanine amidase [Christensenella sp.]
MKKRIFTIIYILLMLAVLSACAGGDAPSQAAAESPAPSASAEPSVLPTVLPTQTLTPEPTPTSDPTLKSGVESEAVTTLQKRLAELGYLKIDEFTTKYGPATERAVRLFQKQNGLNADGIAGAETLARVYADDAKECTLPLSGITIGIDPGHQAQGNSDKEPQAPDSSVKKAKVSSGADGANTGTPEYKITLAVGLKLRELLEENGAEVVMTRESSDVNISNKERAQLFNDAGTDLAVRLHCDGVDDSGVHGALMLVPSGQYTEGFAAQSRAAGEAILSAFVAETGAKNRGVSERDDQTGFNWSTVPVCNMEMGCLSNGSEEALLISDEYQQKCAQGVLQGILDYIA